MRFFIVLALLIASVSSFRINNARSTMVSIIIIIILIIRYILLYY